LPIGQFVYSVKNRVLKDFSSKRNPYCIKNVLTVPKIDFVNHCYNDEPKIDLKLW